MIQISTFLRSLVIHDQTRDGAIFCLPQRRLVCFPLKRQFVRAKYVSCNGKRGLMPQRFTQSVRLVMIYTRNALLFLLAEQFILRAWMCLLSQSIMRLYFYQLHRV